MDVKDDFMTIKELCSEIYKTCPDGWNQAPKGDDEAHDLVINSLVEYKERFVCDITKQIRNICLKNLGEQND